MYRSAKPPLLSSLFRTVDKVLNWEDRLMASLSESIPWEGTNIEADWQQVATIGIITEVTKTIFHFPLLCGIPCLNNVELQVKDQVELGKCRK